jgi:hypothetical protein
MNSIKQSSKWVRYPSEINIFVHIQKDSIIYYKQVPWNIHRENGPAIISRHKYFMWYKIGKLMKAIIKEKVVLDKY